MKKLIPKIIDIICFVGGSMLLLYNLLDYNVGGGTIGRYTMEEYVKKVNTYYYYYDTTTQFLAAIGLGLIVLGFLIRSWRKENRNLNKK